MPQAPMSEQASDELATRMDGADGPPAPAPAGEQPFRIGRYTILRRLGRGGMGVVYAAYDDKLDRKIALKLVYVSRETGTIGQARLVREAQALARLSHPNIVQVYEVGEHDREVYLAMEFVSGQTLRRWLRETHRPWRERLAVYLQAGHGLAAAHAAGLVHRDFKPDNALLADDGRVRVLDFGLARALVGEPDEQAGPSDSLRSSTALDSQELSQPLTAAGLLLGTPAYMSPEQLLRRPADARSDQYSFCVALWEALYGARPFTGRTIGELKREVFAGPPRPPRGEVPTRLGRLLVRGLAADPELRHPDLAALLAALAHDPEQRRRRRLLAATAALVVAAGGAAGYALATRDPAPVCEASSALAGVWDHERSEALAARFAASGLPFAEAAHAGAAAQLDAYAVGLLRLFETHCEARRRGLRGDRALALQAACAERGRGELAALVDVLLTADARAIERASQAAGRLPPIDRCGDLATLLAADDQAPAPGDPALAARVDVQRQRLAVARAELEAGHQEKARELALEVLAEAERLAHPPLLAETLVVRGAAELAAGDFPAAAAALQRAYAVAEAARADTVAIDAAVRLVHVHGERLHDLARAQTWSEVADAKLRRVGDDPAQRVRLLFNGATALLDADQLPDSERQFREVMLLAEQRRDRDPGFYAIVLNALANLKIAQGAPADAEPLLRRSLALREAALGREHPQVAVVLHNLALALYIQRDFHRAIQLFRRALDLRERSLGSDHPGTVETLNGLGAAMCDSGDPPAGLEIYRRVLAIEERRRGTDHRDLFAPLNNLGNALLNAGDHAAAGEYFERARALLERHGQGESPDQALLLYNLGALQHETGRLELATHSLERSLTIREHVYGPNHLEVGISLAYLAQIDLTADRLTAASEHAGRAIDILTDKPAGVLELGRARVVLARVRARDPSTRADALALARLAVAGLADQPGPSSPLHDARVLLADLTRAR